MKNFVKKLLCLLISALLCMPLFACDKPDDGNNEDDFLHSYVDHINKEEISDSNVYFIQNKVSGYHILLSSTTDENRKAVELKAAEELNFFIKDAGYNELPVIFDNQLEGSVDFSKSYISIGNTSYYNYYVEQNNIVNDLDYYKLGNDGYKIRTKQNTVIINAYGNNGIVYGAYGFLERNMDYRYYATDEWAITKAPNVLLKNMNVVSVPDLASR